MDLEEAIRTRRTHKAYRTEPVDRATLDELLELARWAPNHHLTNPWRFRVIGPQARERLKEIEERAKPGTSGKLDRAPTLVAVTARLTGDPRQDREDVLASGVAAFIVLLAAHARGLAGYWRTLDILDGPDGKAALGIGEDETAVGLLHLGHPRQEQRVPERAEPPEYVSYLD
jgi:nitroreductase